MSRKKTDRVTLADVARQAGVAPSTVSYVLRQVEPHFSRYAKDTIRRVQRAAANTGYAPSLLATSLRTRQVPFFGILFEFVRTGDTSPSGGLSWMMWEVFEGIASAARQQRRYPVVLTSPSPEASVADSPEELDRVVHSGLCGVVAAVHPDTWQKHLARWEKRGVPCISLFDRGEPGEPRCYVDLDNHAVGEMAWKYLWKQGHRRIICVRQPGEKLATEERVASFTGLQVESGMSPCVLELKPKNNVSGPIHPADGERLLAALEQTRASAIFAADGGATMMTYKFLTACGVDMPGRCSIVGIDVSRASPLAQTITEVACPGVTVGHEAARLLAGRIDGSLKEGARILVPPVIEERGSVTSL